MKRLCDVGIMDAKASVQDTLRAFFTLGAALLAAKSDDAPLDEAVATSCGWHDLEKLVASSAQLTDTMEADPLAHVVQGYHRFRRYAPRMLETLEISAATVAAPLIEAAGIIKSAGTARPTTFLGGRSKWHRHLKAQKGGDNRLWEVAVLFHLRDAFRSGDIWLAQSRRFGDLKDALVPIAAARATAKLAAPFDPAEWIADRKARRAKSATAPPKDSITAWRG